MYTYDMKNILIKQCPNRKFIYDLRTLKSDKKLYLKLIMYIISRYIFFIVVDGLLK